MFMHRAAVCGSEVAPVLSHYCTRIFNETAFVASKSLLILHHSCYLQNTVALEWGSLESFPHLCRGDYFKC